MIQVVLATAKYYKLWWWTGDLLFQDAETENIQKWLKQLTQRKRG